MGRGIGVPDHLIHAILTCGECPSGLCALLPQWGHSCTSHDLFCLLGWHFKIWQVLQRLKSIENIVMERQSTLTSSVLLSFSCHYACLLVLDINFNHNLLWIYHNVFYWYYTFYLICQFWGDFCNISQYQYCCTLLEHERTGDSSLIMTSLWNVKESIGNCSLCICTKILQRGLEHNISHYCSTSYVEDHVQWGLYSVILS